MPIHKTIMCIQCSQCTYRAPNKYELRHHQNRVHNNRKPWKCSFPACAHRTKCKKDLKKHQQIHETDPELRKPYPCSVDKCNYRAARKYLLVYHIRSIHTPGRTREFQCPICPDNFYNFATLKDHIPTHTRELRFVCAHCDFKTHLRGSLRAHIRSTHATVKKFQCSVPGCNYSCVQQSTIEKHETRIHSNDVTVRRPLLCNFPSCTCRAAVSAQLNHHHNVHHNPNRKREFPCSLCSKEFYDRDGLRVHIARIHTRECKYSREECKFTTNNKYSLRDHIQRVQVEGPGRERKFKCSSCVYSAHDSHNLKRHEKRHEICDSQFECKFCPGKFYPDKISLEFHHFLFHNTSTYQCKTCPFVAASHSSLKGHIRQLHGKKGPDRQHAKKEMLETTRVSSRTGASETVVKSNYKFKSHGKTSQCSMCTFFAPHEQRAGRNLPTHAYPAVVLQRVLLKMI